MEIVQFVHPGFEYHRAEHVGPASRRSGVMAWKPGRSVHDRKFLLAQGSLVEWETGREHEAVSLGFWGEWEGPSVFWRISSTGIPLPRIVHAPFRPIHRPDAPVQNTDPMVFGDAFIYSNCLQPTYASLRHLSPGTIVLFGRYGRSGGLHSFSLDTCLVIDHQRTLSPIPLQTPGRDLLTDAVLGPLFTEEIEGDLSVYFGRRRSSEVTTAFSFFSARLALDMPALFARPELSPVGALHDRISPGNMQGIKLTRDVSPAERDAVWVEVVAQVADQGCALGYEAGPPPVVDDLTAISASMRPPRALQSS